MRKEEENREKMGKMKGEGVERTGGGRMGERGGNRRMGGGGVPALHSGFVTQTHPETDLASWT